MKRVITASSDKYSEVVFVSPQDYDHYFSSLADYIYTNNHKKAALSFIEWANVFEYDGEYLSQLDGMRYVIIAALKGSSYEKRILSEKYFETQYIALDPKKRKEYYKLAANFKEWYERTAQPKDEFGYSYVRNSTMEDIQQWMADNNISEFSAKANI